MTNWTEPKQFEVRVLRQDQRPLSAPARKHRTSCSRPPRVRSAAHHGCGPSVSEIAAQLDLSVKTISTYRPRILEDGYEFQRPTHAICDATRAGVRRAGWVALLGRATACLQAMPTCEKGPNLRCVRRRKSDSEGTKGWGPFYASRHHVRHCLRANSEGGTDRITKDIESSRRLDPTPISCRLSTLLLRRLQKRRRQITSRRSSRATCPSTNASVKSSSIGMEDSSLAANERLSTVLDGQRTLHADTTARNLRAEHQTRVHESQQSPAYPKDSGFGSRIR